MKFNVYIVILSIIFGLSVRAGTIDARIGEKKLAQFVELHSNSLSAIEKIFANKDEPAVRDALAKLCVAIVLVGDVSMGSQEIENALIDVIEKHALKESPSGMIFAMERDAILKSIATGGDARLPQARKVFEIVRYARNAIEARGAYRFSRIKIPYATL